MLRSILIAAIIITTACLLSGCIDLKTKMPIEEENASIVVNSNGVDSSEANANTADARECLDLSRIDEINSKRKGVAESASEVEEYAVYDVLIWPKELGSFKKNNSTLVVIAGNTSRGIVPADYSSQSSGRIELFSEMPKLDQETLKDYFAKNTQSYPLKNLFNLGVKYVIVDENEIDGIFRVGPENEWSSWGEHYTMCPGSPGIFYLSRAGFNNQRDQALVHVGYVFPEMDAGRGYFVLLLKENGSWAINDSLMTWIV